MSKRRQKIGTGRLANRKIFRRTVFLLVLCGVLMFLPIFYQLWHWQVVRHDELEEKAVRQQTSEVSVSAKRGTIYDNDGDVLAISSSAYDVILSPKAIVEKQVALEEEKTKAQKEMNKRLNAGKEVDEDLRRLAEDPVPDVTELIAEGLPRILSSVSEKEIREKCKDTNSQYKKIATKLDATTEQAVRAFISEHRLARCVYLTPNSKRAYPYSTLAAQVIGFTNDNGGAYGIEAELEEQLAGKAGLVVTAHNASGTDLMNFYQDLYDPEDGSDAYLTIDADVQKLCEDALAQGREALRRPQRRLRHRHGLQERRHPGHGQLPHLQSEQLQQNHRLRPEAAGQKGQAQRVRRPEHHVAQQGPQRHLRARLYL